MGGLDFAKTNVFLQKGAGTFSSLLKKNDYLLEISILRLGFKSFTSDMFGQISY